MLTKNRSECTWAAILGRWAQIVIPLVLVLLGTAPVCAQPAADGYFYLQQAEVRTSGRSCSSIFSDIHRGKGEDVGGVVKSLKALNVQYLLEDYDDALSGDRRKTDYVQLDELLREVARNKREIYCKIELALYLQRHKDFSGPAYADLLTEAFAKLEETYASAKKSFEQGELERALYAFDLIAPYKDSSQQFQQIVEEQRALVAQEQAASRDAEVAVPQGGGAIALAAAVWKEEKAEIERPGPISLAAELGPITAAALESPGGQSSVAPPRMQH